jgi:hypothetical protein
VGGVVCVIFWQVFMCLSFGVVVFLYVLVVVVGLLFRGDNFF